MNAGVCHDFERHKKMHQKELHNGIALHIVMLYIFLNSVLYNIK